MSTVIKRLKQNNQEFVPITLAEAVVVNGEYIWGQETITTLDTVLRNLFGNDSNINKLLNTINEQLAGKQDTLLPGEGISINIIDGKPVISANQSLYRIVTSLPTASVECENKIYLVGTPGTNQMVEHICVKDDNGNYYFEQLGLIQVQENVDLSGYVTTNQFNSAIGSINQKITEVEEDITTIQTEVTTIKSNMLSAVNVTTSSGATVSVDYDIPSTLYDSAINAETDNIV